jgi:hypothetical protein
MVIELSLNVAVFWDTALRNPHVNRRFEGTYQGRKSVEQKTNVLSGR